MTEALATATEKLTLADRDGGDNKGDKCDKLDGLLVIIDYHFSTLTQALELHGVRVVRQDTKAIEKEKGYALRLIMPPVGKSACTLNTKPQSIVIEAEDLRVFTCYMRWIFYNVPSPVDLITHINGAPAHAQHVTPANSTLPIKGFIKIEFTKGRQLTNEAVAALLRPLQDCIVPKQTVIFANVPNSPTSKLDALKRRMGPSSVLNKALVWHCYETGHAMLTRAHTFNSGGEADKALHQYGVIYSQGVSSRLFTLPREVYDSDAALPIALLASTIIDACATAAFLRLKPGVRAEIVLTGEEMRTSAIVMSFLLSGKVEKTTLGKVLLPCAGEDHFKHSAATRLLATLLLLAAKRDITMLEEKVLPQLNVLADADPDKEALRHDLLLVQDLLGNPTKRVDYLTGRTSISQLLQQSSVVQLPPRMYITPSSAEGCVRPEGLEGFIDTVHLRAIVESKLRESEKE